MTELTGMRMNPRPYPLGAYPESGGIRFSFVSKVPDCGVLLYDAATGKKLKKLAFPEESRVGNVYCQMVEGLRPEEVCYQFYRGQDIVPDERAKFFRGKRDFGKERSLNGLKAGFLRENYDWEGDRRPKIPYSEAIFYCMHVRGFTRHSSSGVAARGTFAGIIEKIPYLKEIGVTTLELQPAYEFEEIPGERDRQADPAGMFPGTKAPQDEKKMNYWGYKKGYYYAPKSAYSFSDDAPGEFRSLVRELHKNGMELVMQFFFPGEVNRNEVAEILHFWILNYHVDGFHLMGERLPIDMIATDELLADCKILFYGFGQETAREGKEAVSEPHLAEYNDSYLYDLRKFLKGDENMLNSVLRHMRRIPCGRGNIHYLTNYYGFTLADMVSYDYKHNEANGEDNRDGTDYNCSWNCGEEGVTRSRRVKQLRLRQMKNAISILLLTQSTPLIFMGDEFGNSQKGNNNPYCQDNLTTWLDWGAQEKNGELLEFWKQMVAFRKAHPILHPERELRLMDYISCGYPDLSYHGDSAWRPQTEAHNRHIGIMLCGKYAKIDRDREDDFLYIAINMHWEKHRLALPRLPKNMKWSRVITTADQRREPDETCAGENLCVIPYRSIAVYISVPAESPAGQRRGKAAGQA